MKRNLVAVLGFQLVCEWSVRSGRLASLFVAALTLVWSALAGQAQHIAGSSLDDKITDHYLVQEKAAGLNTLSLVLPADRARGVIGVCYRAGDKAGSPVAYLFYDPKSEAVRFLSRATEEGTIDSGVVFDARGATPFLKLQLVYTGSGFDFRSGTISASQIQPVEMLATSTWADSKVVRRQFSLGDEFTRGAFRSDTRDERFAVVVEGEKGTRFTGEFAGLPEAESNWPDFTRVLFLVVLLLAPLVVYQFMLRTISFGKGMTCVIVIAVIELVIIVLAVLSSAELATFRESAYVQNGLAWVQAVLAALENMMSPQGLIIPLFAVALGFGAGKFVDMMYRAGDVAAAQKAGFDTPEEAEESAHVPDGFPTLDPHTMLVRSSQQFTGDFYKFHYEYPHLRTGEYNYDLRGADYADGRLVLLNGVTLEFRPADQE